MSVLDIDVESVFQKIDLDARIALADHVHMALQKDRRFALSGPLTGFGDINVLFAVRLKGQTAGFCKINEKIPDPFFVSRRPGDLRQFEQPVHDLPGLDQFNFGSFFDTCHFFSSKVSKAIRPYFNVNDFRFQ